MPSTSEDVNSFLSFLNELFNSGDPRVRKWALVDTNYLPFVSSLVYLLFVKWLGPTIMQNRKPFDLRNLMIAYNFSIVSIYTIFVSVLLHCLYHTDSFKMLCSPCDVHFDIYIYWATSAGWFIYLLKYVEYADTVFFVLRKKNHLITNLHVIHHASLPIIGWIFYRTEKTGFQFIPVSVNCLIHIIMYTYYGLAAMGPKVQKYLWWKEHLTKLQMLQFIVILMISLIVIPISGCKTSKHGIQVNIVFAVLFLTLFYNFYRKTYKKQSSRIGQKNENDSNQILNGDESVPKETHTQNDFTCNKYTDDFLVHSQIRRR